MIPKIAGVSFTTGNSVSSTAWWPQFSSAIASAPTQLMTGTNPGANSMQALVTSWSAGAGKYIAFYSLSVEATSSAGSASATFSWTTSGGNTVTVTGAGVDTTALAHAPATGFIYMETCSATSIKYGMVTGGFAGPPSVRLTLDLFSLDLWALGA